MKAPSIYCLIGLIAICLFCRIDISAQTRNPSLATVTIEANAKDENAKDEVALLHKLVDEVRQLRLTLQRTTLGAYRVQFAFERQRLQQARVDAATQQVATVRVQLDNTKFSRTQFGERAKETQAQLDQEQDAKRRNLLEQQLKEFKRLLSTQAQQEERQSVREILLTTQLQADQIKLDDLTYQLENLERELAALSNPGAKDQ
jgi:hypothetical protein